MPLPAPDLGPDIHKQLLLIQNHLANIAYAIEAIAKTQNPEFKSRAEAEREAMIQRSQQSEA